MNELSELFRCPRKVFLRFWGPDPVSPVMVKKEKIFEALRAMRRSALVQARGVELHQAWEKSKVRVSRRIVSALGLTILFVIFMFMVLIK